MYIIVSDLYDGEKIINTLNTRLYKKNNSKNHFLQLILNNFVNNNIYYI